MFCLYLFHFLINCVCLGPVTVPMVSQSGSPPIPMPVQVPPGHVMQQIVDENGTLRHVILSTTQHQQIHSQGSVQPHIHGHYVSNNKKQNYYKTKKSVFPLATFKSSPINQKEKIKKISFATIGVQFC